MQILSSSFYCQQDSVLPHFHHSVIQSLNKHLPGKWNGGGRPTVCPQKLPLTLEQGSYVKETVCTAIKMNVRLYEKCIISVQI
jgi:hypothetical protein